LRIIKHYDLPYYPPSRRRIETLVIDMGVPIRLLLEQSTRGLNGYTSNQNQIKNTTLLAKASQQQTQEYQHPMLRLGLVFRMAIELPILPSHLRTLWDITRKSRQIHYPTTLGMISVSRLLKYKRSRPGDQCHCGTRSLGSHSSAVISVMRLYVTPPKMRPWTNENDSYYEETVRYI
jgi:hypothetical protein